MEDISLRALRILREVALIAAEDARVTRKLLDRFAITTELVSFRSHRDCDPLPDLRAHLLSGRDLAFVCDAGTPTIADPGEKLVRVALDCGASVRAVPGPVAALAALVLSGLPTGRFAFDGFPPRARTDRHAFFAALAHEPRTFLLYESPAYLNATLRDLVAVLGPNRPVAVAADLTRPGETVFRGPLSAALDHFRNRRHVGEVTLVIGRAETRMKDEKGPLPNA
jgi:16S rRNA (cytidine1402-2'-O)-methyltransferase